jgi:hypothetical protein
MPDESIQRIIQGPLKLRKTFTVDHAYLKLLRNGAEFSSLPENGNAGVKNCLVLQWDGFYETSLCKTSSILQGSPSIPYDFRLP